VSILLFVAASLFILLGTGLDVASAGLLVSLTVVPPALWFLALQRAAAAGLQPADLFMRYIVVAAFVLWSLNNARRAAGTNPDSADSVGSENRTTLNNTDE